MLTTVFHTIYQEVLDASYYGLVFMLVDDLNHLESRLDVCDFLLIDGAGMSYIF